MSLSRPHESLARLQAKPVYKALLRIGWQEHHIVKGSSHQQLTRLGYPDFTWAFHQAEEVGPKMLARIAKQAGLRPEDL
jgi:predicted RNA binding protein YcfA (HicA-like mRNA interferase family)